MTSKTKPNAAEQTLMTAMTAHQQGQRAQAEKLYRAYLATRPTDPQAHYLLGAVLCEMKAHEPARQSLEQSLKLRAGHAPTLSMLGLVCNALGRTAEAVKCFQDVASAQPRSAEAQCNLARALVEQKSYQDAEAAYRKAIALKRDYEMSWLGLASCQQVAGDLRQAADTLREALTQFPNFINCRILLGRILFDLADYAAAEPVLVSCITHDPNAVESMLLLGSIYFYRSAFEEARVLFTRVVERAPDDPVANNLLGSTLQNLGAFDLAEAHIRKAYEARPEDAEIVTNLGLVLQGQGLTEDALACHRKAIALNPGLAGAWNNAGVSLQHLGHWDEALRHYDHAIELKAGFYQAITNKAHALLALGRLSEGWRDYVHRFDKKSLAPTRRNFPYEMWKGSSLTNQRLLIWTDQGLGDEVLYSSMLPDISRVAAACIFECAPRMVPLFQRSFPGLTVVPRATPPDSRIAAFAPDKQTSLSELGEYVRPSLHAFPKHDGYLKPDESARIRLREKYEAIAQGKKIIGLSWKSENPIYGPFKTIPLEQLSAVLSLPDALFVSLQYGNQHDELRAIKDKLGVDVILDTDVDAVADPDLSAAQIAAMDLVITTSNTTAHFAGAMNIPVWTMAPTGPGALWYWFADLDDSPWYPSMTIFRQTTAKDWSSVVDSVAARLRQWIVV